MNISQKQSILNSIESILSFDFDSFILENNPSGNIDEIKFGEYSVANFKNTYIKVFSQLKSELENGFGLMLPNQENFYNEFSQVTLDAESNTFNSYLKNFGHRNNAAEILKRFVYYQIRQGFWDRSSIKKHDVNTEKLKQAKSELLLVQKNLSENLDVFTKLKSDFQVQIDEFATILKTKNIESAEITTLLEKAKAESEEIENLLSSSTINDADIAKLVSSIDGKLNIISKNIEEYKTSFLQIEKDNNALADELEMQLSTAKENLKASKEGNEFIQNQKDEVTKLIGMAADGSLGYKFNNRKVELESGINNFWRWAVPGSIIVALIWVVMVFTCLKAQLPNEWINLLVNLIKTSPAWIMVGFVFSQYGKERDLQEEYAFKSAIAMTLTAYSQMLSEEDGLDTKVKSSKQEMLLKSIENLYTQPVLKNDKSDKSDLFNSKQLNESLKSISEMIKNIKS